MDSHEIIKYNCLKTIVSFYSILKEEYNKQIPKRIIFIPVYIDKTRRSNFYVNNKKRLLPLFCILKRKVALSSLVQNIYRHQHMISWVDFHVYHCDTRRIILFVEMVCLNKTTESLNYHIYWAQDLFINNL